MEGGKDGGKDGGREGGRLERIRTYIWLTRTPLPRRSQNSAAICTFVVIMSKGQILAPPLS